ncbi:MAG: DUF4124 domain-containing protein [Arenimonas sp.]
MHRIPLFLLLSTLAAAPVPSGPGAASEQVTVYRCVGDKGVVSLQDKPCQKGTQQTRMQMVRPKDAPPRPRSKPEPEPLPPPQEWTYEPLRTPPPELYECTSYDGIVRETEQYDPNPRCEPLALYYPYAERLTPQQAGACLWVRDSCVLLPENETCARFRVARKKAASEALHADSATQPYRDSELVRITQILRDHCD